MHPCGYISWKGLRIFTFRRCAVCSIFLSYKNCVSGWLANRVRHGSPSGFIESGFSRMLQGVLVISQELEKRTHEAARRVGRDLRVYRIPALVDMQRFMAPAAPNGSFDVKHPTFVWCGSDAWKNDVIFLIRALAITRRSGHDARLLVLGSLFESSRGRIAEVMAEEKLPPDSVTFGGYVDACSFAAFFQSAAALLLPLRDDDRSRTRMPNKLAEYLASSRPVVTCNVGSVSEFLQDRVNAFLAKPGDPSSFADQMIAVLNDTNAAEQIGKAGRAACATYLDYRLYADRAAQFFADCVVRRTVAPIKILEKCAPPRLKQKCDKVTNPANFFSPAARLYGAFHTTRRSLSDRTIVAAEVLCPSPFRPVLRLVAPIEARPPSWSITSILS